MNCSPQKFKYQYNETLIDEVMEVMKSMKVVSKTSLLTYFGEGQKRCRPLERTLKILLEKGKIKEVTMTKRSNEDTKVKVSNSRKYYALPYLKLENHKEHWVMVEFVAMYKLLSGCDVAVETNSSMIQGNTRADIVVTEPNGEVYFYEIENLPKSNKTWKLKFDEYKANGLFSKLKIVCRDEYTKERISLFLSTYYEESIAGIALFAEYRKVVKTKLGQRIII